MSFLLNFAIRLQVDSLLLRGLTGMQKASFSSPSLVLRIHPMSTLASSMRQKQPGLMPLTLLCLSSERLRFLSPEQDKVAVSQ